MEAQAGKSLKEEVERNDSFFIIREICICRFKNSVSPAVGSGDKKKKGKSPFFESPSNV